MRCFKGENSLNVFNYYKLRREILTHNGIQFKTLHGFAILRSPSIAYYFSEWGNNRVYKLSESWELLDVNTYLQPSYMVGIGSDLYIAGQSHVFKANSNLQLINQYDPATSPFYRGVYYNSTCNLIFIAAYNLDHRKIDVFDLNLQLTDSISTMPYDPWSIVGFNSELYAGTIDGIIIVIVNKIIVKAFNGCGGNSVLVAFILFDQFGHLTTVSRNPIDKMYLYSSNGTFIGKSSSAPMDPHYIGFDTKGRFVLISASKISIYY